MFNNRLIPNVPSSHVEAHWIEVLAVAARVNYVALSAASNTFLFNLYTSFCVPGAYKINS